MSTLGTFVRERRERLRAQDRRYSVRQVAERVGSIHHEAVFELFARRLPEGAAGITALHQLVGEHATDPAEVTVGIETDRGLWVQALVAASITPPSTRRVLRPRSPSPKAG